MANAIISAPSGPLLESVSVKFVNPDISANITTEFTYYFNGNFF